MLALWLRIARFGAFRTPTVTGLGVRMSMIVARAARLISANTILAMIAARGFLPPRPRIAHLVTFRPALLA